MATATRSTRNVTKSVTVTEEVITLELSRPEADFLLSVLNSVGGDPELSPRRFQAPISKALHGVGADGWSVSGKNGSIFFAKG